ncbi:MAG: protein arginine kinase [Thermovirgaceae bacterium]
MSCAGFASLPLEWLSGGKDQSDIVLSSRKRLARNLGEYPFPARCDDRTRREVSRRVLDRLSETPVINVSGTWEMDDLDDMKREVLVERHLISPDFSRQTGGGKVAVVDESGIVSLMINEEDHLRIQVFLGGLDFHECQRIAGRVDSALEELGYAFDEEFGYLTACPTNTGTGLRASAMLHIPGLEIKRRLGKIIRECNRVGLTVRGMYGEGSESIGALFQVSNQVTLGQREDELIEKVSGVIASVVQQERAARLAIRESDSEKLEDKMWRAWGIVRYARSIDIREAMQMLSWIRMGSEMGILPKISPGDWNSLVLEIQPAHLQCFEGRRLKEQEISSARATLLRERLGT